MGGVARGAASASRVHELAGRRVVLTASSTSELLGLSAPTVNAAFVRLQEAGILREVTPGRAVTRLGSPCPCPERRPGNSLRSPC